MENYNDRMKQIEEVSESIAVANHQLNRLLQKFGWNKSYLKNETENLTNCPFDENHTVKKENYIKHVDNCLMKELKIDSCGEKVEDTSSPLFCYAESNLVVPVFLKEKDYEKAGVNLEKCGMPLTKNKVSIINIASDGVTKDSLIETDNEINTYIPTDPLDELRFIYSWKLIPTQYIKIDTLNIDKDELSRWIKDQLPEILQAGYQYNFIKEQCTTVYHPDRLCEIMQPLLNNDTHQFVLNLWKFVTAKTLCKLQNIAEHTRNEFDFYGSSSYQDKASSSKLNEDAGKFSDSILAKVPIEWIRCNLSREQKLHIYEEVCKIGKELCSPSLKFSELEAEAEHQMKVLISHSESVGKTHLEIMAEMRDFKRRRQSYRGKNKSDAKLTAVEVLREIVEQQMLYLDIVNGRSAEKPASEQDKKVKEEPSKNPELEKNKSAEIRNEKRSRSRSRDRNRERSRNRSGSRDRNRERNKNRNRSRERYRERRRNRSRSNDRKYRRRDRSKSRDRYSKNSRQRRRSSDRKYDKDRSRKDEIKDEKYRERSPFIKKDPEQINEKEVSNITYY